MAQKDEAEEFAAKLKTFGVTAEDVRRALGVPARTAHWYTYEVANIRTSQKLWDIIERCTWEKGSEEEKIILLKILRNTRRMDWRWHVFEYADENGLNETAGIALMEILRLATEEDDINGVLEYGRKYTAVLDAALWDLICGRKKHSMARRRRNRHHQQPRLRILQAKTAS